MYRKVFEEKGLQLVEPDEAGKAEVMKWIYEVKAGTITLTEEGFSKFIRRASLDIEMPIILGCTELPVLIQMLNMKGQFVDPTKVLASKCVEFASEV